MLPLLFARRRSASEGVRAALSLGFLGSLVAGGGCTARRATSIECTRNSDCTGAQACFAGYCRPRCVVPRDCLEGYTCVVSSDPTLNFCQVACTTSDMCDPSNVCFRSVCTITCASSADCARFGPSSTCDPTSRACVLVPLASVADGGVDAGPSDAAAEAEAGPPPDAQDAQSPPDVQDVSDAGAPDTKPVDASLTDADASSADAPAEAALVDGAPDGPPDTMAPTLLRSTPMNAATAVPPCAGSPCRATVTLVFSESMNAALTQSLVTEAWDAAARTALYRAVPNTGTRFTWSTTSVANDTLTIALSWVRFPELSQLRFTLATSGLADLAGNRIGAPVVLTFTTDVLDNVLPVADSGQGVCYSDTAMQPCGNASWPGQDGDFVNTPTARMLVGPTPDPGVPTEATVTDTVTGLLWRSCPEGLSGPGCMTGSATTLAWVDALNVCARYNALNGGAGLAGRTDWRLNTRRELLSLPNRGLGVPPLETALFPGGGGAQNLTATLELNPPFDSYDYIGFGTLAGGSLPSSLSNPSGMQGQDAPRCVAGGAVRPRSLSVRADGTVDDNVTGLRWQRCQEAQTGATCSGSAASRTWQQALQYCSTLTLGGRSWRLPTVNELEGLLLFGASRELDVTAFPNASGLLHWTSTTMNPTPANAWSVNFSTGQVSGLAKTTTARVRCVTAP